MNDPVIDVLKKAARELAIRAVKSRKQSAEYREALAIEEADEEKALAAYNALEAAILARDRNTPDKDRRGLPWTTRGVNEELA